MKSGRDGSVAATAGTSEFLIIGAFRMPTLNTLPGYHRDRTSTMFQDGIIIVTRMLVYHGY